MKTSRRKFAAMLMGLPFVGTIIGKIKPNPSEFYIRSGGAVTLCGARTVKMVVDGPVNCAEALFIGPDGKVTSKPNQRFIGVALESAVIDGDEISVCLT